MSELSVLMVSFNTRVLTLEALRSLYAETTSPLQVIVVDNASSDGSADAIAQAFPEVMLIRSETNLGFGVASNLASGQASSRHLLLLNPDTRVLPAAVDRLLQFAREHPEARIWGGRTLNDDGSLNPASCWRRASLWSLLCSSLGVAALFPHDPRFNSEAYGGWGRDSVREVDIVSGCFLMIERDLWRSLGGFDPSFFMYGEDADLCLRAMQQGARPLITPDAEIVHYSGASETGLENKLVRLYRAKVQLMERHWPRWASRVGGILMQGNVLRRWALFRLRAKAQTSDAGRQNPFAKIWSRRQEWLGSERDSDDGMNDPPRGVTVGGLHRGQS